MNTANLNSGFMPKTFDYWWFGNVDYYYLLWLKWFALFLQQLIR